MRPPAPCEAFAEYPEEAEARRARLPCSPRAVAAAGPGGEAAGQSGGARAGEEGRRKAAARTGTAAVEGEVAGRAGAELGAGGPPPLLLLLPVTSRLLMIMNYKKR